MVMMVIRKFWRDGGNQMARRVVKRYAPKNRAAVVALRIADLILFR